MPFLDMSKVSKVYKGDRNEKTIALDDVSCNIEEGEFVTVLGPTGCGKTTLLRLIAGLEKISMGNINIAGKQVKGINNDVTLVFQQYSLFPWSTVIDNICFSWEVKGMNKMEQYKKAERLINLVGLSGFENAFPFELSGGMQQRVAIARGLAYDSKILLLDEPFGALDERMRHRLQEELFKIWEREKKTVILVTHNIDEAIYLASKILVMKDRPGSVVEEIFVDLKRPRDRRSNEFLDLHVRIRGIIEGLLVNDIKGGDVNLK